MGFFRRLGIYGDLPTRVLRWVVGRCPWFLEPVLVAGYAFLIWLVCGKMRRVIAGNLAVMRPERVRWLNGFRAYTVFWNFAWAMADAARENAGGRDIRWEVSGLGNFKEASELEGGMILLTAHMGSYDLAARFFAGRFGRKVNAVRAPERQEKFQEFSERARESEGDDGVATRYNREGGMLGVELVKALSEGEAVALQGDRVVFDVSPVEVEFGGGRSWELPKGPFALAAAGRVPIYPVFVVRTGYRSYRVEMGKAIGIRMARGEEREMAMREAAESFGAVLGELVRRNWGQWFVFENRFLEKGGNRG